MCMSSAKKCGYVLRRETNSEREYVRDDGWGLTMNQRPYVSGGPIPSQLVLNEMSTMTIHARQPLISKGRMMGQKLLKRDATNLLYPQNIPPLTTPNKTIFPNRHLSLKKSLCLLPIWNQGKGASGNHPNVS